MREQMNELIKMNEFRPFPRRFERLISVLGARNSAVKTDPLSSFIQLTAISLHLNRSLIILKVEFHIKRSHF